MTGEEAAVRLAMRRMEQRWDQQRQWFDRQLAGARRNALMPLLWHEGAKLLEYAGLVRPGETGHSTMSYRGLMNGGWSTVEEETAPSPRFIDPYYEGSAQTVRAWLDGDLFGGVKGHNTLALPRPMPVWHIGFQWEADDEELLAKDNADYLRYVGRAWHFAPFVGEPFFYWWRIAKDQDGRFCTGEQNIRMIDQWEYERIRGRDPWRF